LEGNAEAAKQSWVHAGSWCSLQASRGSLAKAVCRLRVAKPTSASKHTGVHRTALWEVCVNKPMQKAPSVTVAETCVHIIATYTPYCVTAQQLLKILNDVFWLDM